MKLIRNDASVITAGPGAWFTGAVHLDHVAAAAYIDVRIHMRGRRPSFRADVVATRRARAVDEQIVRLALSDNDEHSACMTPLVVTNLAVSVDGFVAYPDDSVGELCDFYTDGPVKFTDFAGHEFAMNEASAALFREALDATGAYLMGRRLYDHTNGWNARPPSEAPIVLVTHDPPVEIPKGPVPITVATDVAEGVAQAKALAGDGVVAVAGAALARSCLEAGLLDEIVLNLIPILLGEGVPYLAGVANAPVRLSDPVVTEAAGVTHLRYRVLR